MNWTEILSNPITGNILLLLAAIIGVLGSYSIYKIRLNDRRKSARRALTAELESMSILTQWAEGMYDVPTQRLFPTVAYEAHLENIGFLSDEEAEKLTSFYSQAIILDDLVELHRETIRTASMRSNAYDTGKQNREEIIRSRLDSLAIERWQTLQLLKNKLGEPSEPPEKLDLPKVEGESIYIKHPIFQKYGEMLVSKGYLEPDPQSPEYYLLTGKGENWIADVAEEEPGF